MPNTAQEYDKVIDICQDIFVKKMQDYGQPGEYSARPPLPTRSISKQTVYSRIEEKGLRKSGKACSRFIGHYYSLGTDPTQLGPVTTPPR